MSVLTEAIRNKDVYLNKQIVEEKASELEGIYEGFLSDLSQLVKEFTHTRQSILNGEFKRQAKPN